MKNNFVGINDIDKSKKTAKMKKYAVQLDIKIKLMYNRT